MDQETTLDTLDEIEALLRRMELLAARAAEDDCGELSRVLLQRRLEALRRELDRTADRLQCGL